MTPDTTTDWLSVIAAWIAALAAVGTVLLTAGLLWAAWRAYRTATGTLRQMREDSEAQREDSARATRPYVYPTIVPGLAGTNTWDLVLENTGRTAAYDLHVRIDAEPSQDDEIKRAVRVLAEAGTMLPPRGRIRTFWAMGEDPEADPPQALGYPRATVTLSYTDSEHHRFDRERSVTLDPQLLGLTPEPGSGATAKGKDTEAKDTVHALRAISRHLGEIHR